MISTISSLFIVYNPLAARMLVLVLTPNLSTIRYIVYCQERTVLESYITLYCVTYDPFYCDIDPERIWHIVQRSGGSVHASAASCLDFYVPERIITQIMLMDPGLRIRHARSYI